MQHNFGMEQQWRQGPDGGVMEMRKEKSRDAARSRRGKENQEFYELAKMLPLPPAITTQLDKASIIRLTISYLKLREFTRSGDPSWSSSNSYHKNIKGLRGRNQGCSPEDIFEVHQGSHVLQSLDGFAFTLAADGRFLYISETVSIYLGLSQVEMAGSSVFEYIHSDDHVELAEQLGLTLTSSSPTSSVASSAAASLVNASLTASSSPSSLTSDDGCAGSGGNSQTGGTMNPDVCMPMSLSSSSRYRGYDRAFCIRMKSTLTKRGCHFKSSGYRVVLVLGHLRPKAQFHSHHQNEQKNPPNLMGLVALAIALPSPSVNEMKLEPDMFVSRINMDFRLAHCEAKVSDLLHYTPEELLGRSLYALCHAQDVENLRKTHTDLMKKGQVMSPYYRILNRTGGWVWVQTCATVICNSKSSDEQNIICVNYVLSGSVDNSVILDEHQMTPSVAHVKSDVTNDFGRQHSPSRSGSNTPTPQRTNSPSLKPLTPSMSVGCDSLTPPLIDHHNHHHRQNGSLHGVTKDLVHEAVLESRMHNPHDTHLQESHHHDIRSSSQMDHDQQVMMSDTHLSHGGPLTPHNDTHIPHVAPLTPQLTPVSRIGGLTPIVSAEGETIKTETGSILTPLTVPEHLDDIMHSQKLSPITPQSHMHYTSLPSHTQLSPAAINRFSPISNTQISPNHQYPTMEKVPQHDSEGSVRHLEAAMTRHLPQDGMMDSGGVGVGVTTSLGGLSEGFHTIQWAGGQENHSSSTILRQLCSTKRESVIKTSRDPQEIIVNPNSAHCTAPTIITSLPTTTSSGLMSVPSGYPGYQISPPSSVSPDRLKTMTCEPYTDLYNSNIYPSAHVSSKNPYDPVRWYQT
ncbi:protein trachealess [Hyalella azteca]|uniref:Protein trachealess n=1 Tax=Hyalella azteca TaxID=294128 RepID=A0A8B7NHY1_HYAAZ|nr:protein trachealess [Hyalella azteca]